MNYDESVATIETQLRLLGADLPVPLIGKSMGWRCWFRNYAGNMAHADFNSRLGALKFTLDKALDGRAYPL